MANSKITNLVVIAILSSLLIILGSKLFFESRTDTFFYVYGVIVTITVFALFSVSRRYKDFSIEIIENNLNAGKKRPFISCVLAVKDEEEVIGSCIDSLLNSDYENKEIIVVNDASTDNTLKILRKYEKKHLIKVFNMKKNIGKKKAITYGVKRAKGEMYVFTDSDSVMEKTAISRCMEIMIHDDSVGAVSGHGRALNADKNLITKIQDSWYEGQFSIKKAFESVFGTVTCISGPLAVFRKEAIFNYFPAWENDSFLGKEFRFSTDRSLTAFVLGSLEIGPKLKKKYANSWFVKSKDYEVKRWKLYYCKSAKVWTNVPDNFPRMIKQQIRWKKSFIRSIFLTGKFFWRKPLIPALRYYFSIMFVFVGPIVVFRQMIWMPYHGNFLSIFLYVGGVTFIGFLYAIAYRLENPGDRKWIYRPFMSVLSTTVLSWLIFYSIATIRKNIWHRG